MLMNFCSDKMIPDAAVSDYAKAESTAYVSSSYVPPTFEILINLSLPDATTDLFYAQMGFCVSQ